MLVFLDIDGVMVPAKGWKSPELLADGFPAFSPKATQVLQQIISADCTIMLTTSHKANFSLEAWKTLFRNRGIVVGELKSLPENINNLSRKEEILQWFGTHKTEEAFVIIDDDSSLNDLPPFLKRNWIATSPYIGLTEGHLEGIRVVLGLPLEAV